MKILKIELPVNVILSFRDCDVSSKEELADVILDVERQLNNLKLESEVKPIKIYPRFHLGGNPDEWEVIGTGYIPPEMWGSDCSD